MQGVFLKTRDVIGPPKSGGPKSGGPRKISEKVGDQNQKWGTKIFSCFPVFFGANLALWIALSPSGQNCMFNRKVMQSIQLETKPTKTIMHSDLLIHLLDPVHAVQCREYQHTLLESLQLGDNQNGCSGIRIVLI